MINKTLNAITVALHNEFGNDYHYYIEDVEQNLSTPCFTVDMLNPMQRSDSPTTYQRTMPLVIHYFSGNKISPKKDSYGIEERISSALEYIIVEGRKLRSENIECQMVDDTLQVFVTYRFWTKVIEAEPDYIEELEDVNTSVYRKDN